MAEISIQVGKRVKAKRLSKELSQEELAFKCGLHRTYISDVERGVRNITIVNLEKIAQALNTRTRDLLE